MSASSSLPHSRTEGAPALRAECSARWTRRAPHIAPYVSIERGLGDAVAQAFRVDRPRASAVACELPRADRIAPQPRILGCEPHRALERRRGSEIIAPRHAGHAEFVEIRNARGLDRDCALERSARLDEALLLAADLSEPRPVPGRRLAELHRALARRVRA